MDQMEYLNDRTWPHHGMSPYAICRDHTSDKYGLGGGTAPYVRRPFAAVPKASFSVAMAVMDKVEGWKEEEWVGRTSPRPCGYTPRLHCATDARETHPILATIIESVCCVTEDSLRDHEWITERKVTMKENLILQALHYDIEVPCPLQLVLRCFQHRQTPTASS